MLADRMSRLTAAGLGSVGAAASLKTAQAIVEAVGLLEGMTNLRCRAVAIDTVNAVTPGLDENRART
jgi:hypothetical protein